MDTNILCSALRLARLRVAVVLRDSKWPVAGERNLGARVLCFAPLVSYPIVLLTLLAAARGHNDSQRLATLETRCKKKKTIATARPRHASPLVQSKRYSTGAIYMHNIPSTKTPR